MNRVRKLLSKAINQQKYGLRRFESTSRYAFDYLNGRNGDKADKTDDHGRNNIIPRYFQFDIDADRLKWINNFNKQVDNHDMAWCNLLDNCVNHM